MFASVSGLVKNDEIVVQRTDDGESWYMRFGWTATFVMKDAELDALKYAVDSAVFERDMGLDGAL